MRGLQLTVLISTAIVLFGIAGWAMWHTWQEQELPREGPQPEHGDPVRAVIRLDEHGRISFKGLELFPARTTGSYAAVSDRLTTELRAWLAGIEGPRDAVSAGIVTRGTIDPGHVELIRSACRDAGITSIEVRHGKP